MADPETTANTTPPDETDSTIELDDLSNLSNLSLEAELQALELNANNSWASEDQPQHDPFSALYDNGNEIEPIEPTNAGKRKRKRKTRRKTKRKSLKKRRKTKKRKSLKKKRKTKRK